MSYEDGSTNYQAAISNGYVIGNPKYASSEPHHGPGYAYQTMYHAMTECTLRLIIDGDVDEGDMYGRDMTGDEAQIDLKSIPREIEIEIVEQFPAKSKSENDYEAMNEDYTHAEEKGSIRTYMVRETSGGEDWIELGNDSNDYEITQMGYDEYEREDGVWTCRSYNAKIMARNKAVTQVEGDNNEHN
jgi:hypothetical protein